MSYYADPYRYPYAGPASFSDCGSKFVCGPTCCTVVPSAPAQGVGVFGYGGPLAAQAGFGVAPGCAYDERGARGPAGWAEVGWIVSAGRRRRPHGGRWRAQNGGRPRARNARRTIARGQQQRQQRRDESASPTAQTRSFTPRSQFRKDKWASEHEDGDEYDIFDEEEEYLARSDGGCGGGGGLAVNCRARRYRLYARPAHGWCGSYDVSQWQYAVTEEGVPRCDAILIVLRENPRVRGPRSLVWQELQSGDLIHVPGEPDSFRVHLYSDDYAY